MEQIHDIGCNNATNAHANYFTGNIIPNLWYKQIVTKSGRPDLSAITILAEIVYWYRPGKNGAKKFKSDAWQTSYEYFESKFGYNRQKIRRTLVRLEELELIKRDVRIVKHYGQKYGNVLFILIKDLSLLGKKPIPQQKTEAKKISNNEVKIDKPLLQKCRDNIDIETKEKNNRSNFSNGKKLYLKDFYPLSQSDLEFLQNESDRNFNLNATNEILLNMSKKLPDHQFPNKQSFLKYLSKALAYEMRQAEIINNDNFRIQSNKTPEERTYEEEEKTISEIEYSSDCSNEAKLKRKIISFFDRKKAVQILKNIKIYQTNIILENRKNFSNQEIELIRKEAKFIWGIEDIEICFSNRIFKKPNILVKETQPIFWKKVRNKLSDNLGEKIDEAWFSKLIPEIDSEGRNVRLKADSGFIRDWINNNYEKLIRQFLHDDGYKLEEVY